MLLPSRKVVKRESLSKLRLRHSEPLPEYFDTRYPAHLRQLLAGERLGIRVGKRYGHDLLPAPLQQRSFSSIGTPEQTGGWLTRIQKKREPSLLSSTENCRTSSPRRVIMPSGRKKLSPKREYKSQRLELRLAPSAKKVIQQAMSVTGLAAGDLAYEGARRLLDEHQRMVLSGADRDAFLAAIGRTPDPSPRLVEALKRHRHLFG